MNPLEIPEDPDPYDLSGKGEEFDRACNVHPSPPSPCAHLWEDLGVDSEPMTPRERERWEEAFLKATNPTAWRKAQWRKKEGQRRELAEAQRIERAQIEAEEKARKTLPPPEPGPARPRTAPKNPEWLGPRQPRETRQRPRGQGRQARQGRQADGWDRVIHWVAVIGAVITMLRMLLLLG